ncbi:hypothetical protein SAZ11_50875 [Streptomyces sp. FXJ1.4098]|nr:hypothetical protein [Streptomyces sp. FXJ1.4098]
MFAVGDRATLFTESAAFQVTRHGHPVWKVVLPIGGHALIRPEGGRTVAAPGLLVPPRLVHTCAATSAYAALFIEPWLIPPGPGLYGSTSARCAGCSRRWGRSASAVRPPRRTRTRRTTSSSP